MFSAVGIGNSSDLLFMDNLEWFEMLLPFIIPQ